MLRDVSAVDERAGSLEFYRTEDRRTSRRRLLTCGHAIDVREPYRYAVWKLRGVVGLGQSELCDVCRRHGDHY